MPTHFSTHARDKRILLPCLPLIEQCGRQDRAVRRARIRKCTYEFTLLRFLAVGAVLLEESDQIRDLLFVLDAGERHLGARHVTTGIDDIFAKYFFRPHPVKCLECV